MPGNQALLTHLIDNLIGNAIRHNQPGGWIHVATATATATGTGTGTGTGTARRRPAQYRLLGPAAWWAGRADHAPRQAGLRMEATPGCPVTN
ncbi:MAG: ATP-binding protein [Streptosporangiaceae bacterium]